MAPESALPVSESPAKSGPSRPTFIPMPLADLRRLQAEDYSHLPLIQESRRCRAAVQSAAEQIFGGDWNHYSNALKPEVIHVVQSVALHLQKTGRAVRYLEIGSARGLSMGLVGSLLRELRVPATLTSLDPYFATGYFEGGRSPAALTQHVPIDKSIRDGALALYDRLGLEVNLLEYTSTAALPELVRQGESFNWIYVDGSHEGLAPAFDFGLSLALIERPGVIVLDDPCWNDVAPLRHLADQHLVCLGACWKLAAYQVS